MTASEQKGTAPDPLPISRGVFLLALFFILGVYWGFAFYLERIDLTVALNSWLQSWVPNLPDLPQPLVALAGFFHPRVLRHFIPVVTGWVLAYLAAVSLLRILYDLPDHASARRFLSRLVGETPQGVVVTVSANKLPALRESSELLRVGGPGMVKVSPGEVAVTEVNGRFYRLLPSGSHKIGRFEYIHTLVDLRTQERHITEIPLVTRDGIDISADVTLSFRIDTGGPVPTREDPFPYDPEAVRQAAYTAIVRGDGVVNSWQDMPGNISRGILTALIAKYRLDELIQPGGRSDPYTTLNQELRRGLRNPLADVGVELLDAHIGHLQLPETASKQYIDRWSAELDTRIRLTMAEGGANSLAELEIARAEAEWIMFQAIMESLNNARREGSGGAMREMIALRMVEALERMAHQSGSLQPLPDHLLPQLLNWKRALLPENRLPTQQQGRD
jgi:regulator of protease activity HflC (stomatin/prohibitin superfamily)